MKWISKGGSTQLGIILFTQIQNLEDNFFFKFFGKIFIVIFVEKLAFFKTLDHHIPKTAWLTSVKFWNMNICLNPSNFSQNGGLWKKK